MELQERLRRLGEAAAGQVESGMTLGLGTGSTADAVIEAIGRRVAEGLIVSGVATSSRTEALATRLGIPLRQLDEIDRLDLGIDGADEIDPSLALVKGRGGALLYEKLVAERCDAYLIVSSSDKLVPRLGVRLPLPVEIVPFGATHTIAALQALDLNPTLRRDERGDPVVTDGGHWLADCATGPIADPRALADRLKGLTGVVDHGLFVDHATSALTIDKDGVLTEHRRPPR
jgi:ribose 5-phosphate isomerase A